MQIAQIHSEIPYAAPFKGNWPDMLIIHAMGEFIENGEDDFFAPDWLTKLGLSAHYFVTPSGVVLQQRNQQEIAYHAGREFNGRSIGIEILVPGIHTYATFLEAIKHNWINDMSLQFKATVEIANEVCDARSITEAVRHSDVAPGRKPDPGPGFPWTSFRAAMNGLPF